MSATLSQQILDNSSLKKFRDRTSKSRLIFERAKDVYPSGTTRAPYYYAPYPIYLAKGEGCYVWDIDGNRYLDFTNNMGPLILGHLNPTVQKAVARQVEAFWCGSPTELDVRLADTILSAFPFAEKLGFTASGTEADMKIIRAARAHTGKKTVMLSTGSYHGTSDGLMPGAGVPEDVNRLIAYFRYNDEESFRTTVNKVDDDLAAVVLEGVLGSAGSVPPTNSFLEAVREETERRGVPLIFDEVVTGFRVARGGIAQRFGVEPDGVVLGKIIGGGFPIGAFLATKEIMSAFDYPFSSEFPLIGKPKILPAGTFNAHAVAMAAGLATLDLLNGDAYEHLEKIGGKIRTALSKLCDEHGVPNRVTGISSMFKLHFSADNIYNYETATKYSDERRGRLFDLMMLARGIFLPMSHTGFCSVPMGNPEVEQFEEVANEALEETIALTKGEKGT